MFEALNRFQDQVVLAFVHVFPGCRDLGQSVAFLCHKLGHILETQLVLKHFCDLWTVLVHFILSLLPIVSFTPAHKCVPESQAEPVFDPSDLDLLLSIGDVAIDSEVPQGMQKF